MKLLSPSDAHMWRGLVGRGGVEFVMRRPSRTAWWFRVPLYLERNGAIPLFGADDGNFGVQHRRFWHVWGPMVVGAYCMIVSLIAVGAAILW